ncbi:hypothetical protein DFQ28_008256 [Apophysomyces sp. BC1034]|nr:hypothetical protein DFQ30_007960 [Apophysomyces sp. BC1015]KAG0175811.1 hypothetical protein DFQ29_006989 [Apophysomyces sp. BC1021]KAG0186140.1 hypothetical protein DFQ28_008256 [Apophysomyces sp. BC1034]
MAKTSSTDSSEAKRWLIIGAHKAGATEKHIARIAGLSKIAVRHILLNYRRTGSPSLPKKPSSKVRQKPIVEYDENGNLIESSDDDNDEDNQGEGKAKETKKRNPERIVKRSPKINRQVTAKDLIAYVVDQVRKTDREQGKDPLTSGNADKPSWRPLTPPREHGASTSPSTSFPPSSSSPPPPPSSPSSNVVTTSAPTYLPPSPPLHAQGDTSKQNRPPGKYDQTIRGYEIWTHEDDMALLDHVLTHLQGGRWRDLESKLDGRHSARLCSDRWQFLRKHLLKGLGSTGSPSW